MKYFIILLGFMTLLTSCGTDKLPIYKISHESTANFKAEFSDFEGDYWSETCSPTVSLYVEKDQYGSRYSAINSEFVSINTNYLQKSHIIERALRKTVRDQEYRGDIYFDGIVYDKNDIYKLYLLDGDRKLVVRNVSPHVYWDIVRNYAIGDSIQLNWLKEIKK